MTPVVVLVGLHDDGEDWLKREIGARVVVARTGKAAIDAMLESKPDLVAIAERLTDGTGEDLVRRMRHEPQLSSVPIIFCFDGIPEPHLARVLVHELGVERLLVHPLARPELARNVAALLGVQLKTSIGERDTRVADGVAALWLRFRDQIFERVNALEAAISLLATGSLADDNRREAERVAHKLAGSLGTFGFGDGSTIAREIELDLAESRAAEPHRVRRLFDLVGRLRAELERPNHSAPTVDAPRRQRPPMLVVSSDREYANSIVAAAINRGHGAARFADRTSSELDDVDARPEIVVVDLTPELQSTTGDALIRRLSNSTPPVPVVVIGDRDRLPDELSLTSRDSRGYLRRPAKPDEVVDEAQRVLRRLRPQRGRILAVDDDPQVLEFVRSLLERDGFAVHAVGDPLELIAQLDLEPADLLILDLDMPYMSGIELCRLVRADSRWHGVPVVLLTANREADVVERVFAAGADDFVLKPLVGPELTTRVVNRLERNRLYRTMAETDFLTGVSNRRRSTELFEQLRRLAIRHHQPLCFAILDLDKFKQVNDAYGHAVGDTVLREFAAFLLRTFRGEDIVGRWGGEEFVLGTYGMDRKTGMRRIEAAIEEFGSHPIDDSAGGELRVTFSAGIAQHGPDGTDLQSLYLAADEALYRAKSDGRATVRAATDGEATRLASPDHPVRAPGRRPSVRS